MDQIKFKTAITEIWQNTRQPEEPNNDMYVVAKLFNEKYMSGNAQLNDKM